MYHKNDLRKVKNILFKVSKRHFGMMKIRYPDYFWDQDIVRDINELNEVS